MFVFEYCRILASLKHPHIVAFHESVYDADKQVLFIVQVVFIIVIILLLWIPELHVSPWLVMAVAMSAQT